MFLLIFKVIKKDSKNSRKVQHSIFIRVCTQKLLPKSNRKREHQGGVTNEVKNQLAGKETSSSFNID